jgi:hypothetical protein
VNLPLAGKAAVDRVVGVIACLKQLSVLSALAADCNSCYSLSTSDNPLLHRESNEISIRLEVESRHDAIFVEGNCACLDSQDLARLLHSRPRGKEVHNVALPLSERFTMMRHVLRKHTFPRYPKNN